MRLLLLAMIALCGCVIGDSDAASAQNASLSWSLQGTTYGINAGSGARAPISWFGHVRVTSLQQNDRLVLSFPATDLFTTLSQDETASSTFTSPQTAIYEVDGQFSRNQLKQVAVFEPHLCVKACPSLATAGVAIVSDRHTRIKIPFREVVSPTEISLYVGNSRFIVAGLDSKSLSITESAPATSPSSGVKIVIGGDSAAAPFSLGLFSLCQSGAMKCGDL